MLNHKTKNSKIYVIEIKETGFIYVGETGKGENSRGSFWQRIYSHIHDVNEIIAGNKKADITLHPALIEAGITSTELFREKCRWIVVESIEYEGRDTELDFIQLFERIAPGLLLNEKGRINK